MLLTLLAAAVVAVDQPVKIGGPEVTVSSTPVMGAHHWAEQPSPSELQTPMPPGYPSGFVNIYNCRAEPDGRLSACAVSGPEHLTSLAREMLPRFRLSAGDVALLGRDGWVNTWIQWGDPPAVCAPPDCNGVVPLPPPLPR